jgi:hypothetical protein
MQSIVMLSVIYAECHKQAFYAKYHYAEYRGSVECRTLMGRLLALPQILDGSQVFWSKTIWSTGVLSKQ